MPARSKTPPQIRLKRAEQNARRREDIINAAWMLFLEKGYEGTRMEDVADRAGVSRYPAFYLFGDKQTLFFELWKSQVHAILGSIDTRIKPGDTLANNLAALARWMVEGSAQSTDGRSGLSFVVQTIGLSRPDIEKKILEVADHIVGASAKIIQGSSLEAGQALRGPVREVAAHLTAYVNGLSSLRTSAGRAKLNAPNLQAAFLAIVTVEKPSSAAKARRGRRS